MPYKHTEKLIPKKHDKRVKLTDQDRIEIRDLYAADVMSQRELAKAYGVSRRLIVFVIYPERMEANYANRIANGGSKQYYVKEKHTIAMRTHRKHKQDLYLKGELE
jgi:ribosomal protein L16/L10AE